MNRTIVTHSSPDQDAASSVWLVHRFLKGWENADVAFVPAGTTLNNEDPDVDDNIMHVDTGMGKFDHHQNSDETCAAELVFNHLVKEKLLEKETREACARMIDVICDEDHFKDIYRPEPDSDLYDFMHSSILTGAHSILENDHQVIEFMEKIFDSILQAMIYKIRAEKEIGKGFEYHTQWGKTLAIETENRETSRLAQKKGFSMVISKSKNGQVRIKTRPDVKKDLQDVYKIVLKKDPTATWFYHASGHMLLNGSSKNPDMIPSKLTLRELITMTKV